MPATRSRDILLDRAYRGEWRSREISDWATRHYGLISRLKLLGFGLSEDQIDRLIARGFLLPAAPGIYYVGHRSGVPGQSEAVALAAAGPTAALSGVSAAAWRGMTEPVRGPVHLIVPRARHDRLPGVIRHVDLIGEHETSVVRGLRCVVPERAVLDLPGQQLRQALQWLMRNGLAVEPLVERMHGRRGAKRFRAEVAALVPQLAHTMSELEARFVRLCRTYGLPMPIVNGTLAGGDLLDCTWPGSDVVVELDGRRWHEHRDREDRARDRRRLLEGRRPLRYGWTDVTVDAAATARELREIGIHRA